MASLGRAWQACVRHPDGRLVDYCALLVASLVSIGIPMYNHAASLQRAVASALRPAYGVLSVCRTDAPSG